MTRAIARACVATALVGLVLSIATPAGAHGTNGPPASNFRTDLEGLAPAARGVTVTLGPDREQIVVRIAGSARVTVAGYQDEPYLRVDARGVFENRSSPAIAMNQSRLPMVTRPSTPHGSPRWVRISSGSVARWHDHRVHWMGGAVPSVVRRDPDHPHVIARWTIPIQVDRQASVITGTIRWDPPPAAWPWWLSATAIAAITVFVVRMRRAAVAAALAIMAVTESVHLWASWPFSLGSAPARIGDGLPSIAAVGACLGALVWLVRRDAWSAAPVVILAGLFVFVSGGLADLPTLSHSSVPSRLAPAVARLVVAVALGTGLGTTISGGRRLRAPRPSS